MIREPFFENTNKFVRNIVSKLYEIHWELTHSSPMLHLQLPMKKWMEEASADEVHSFLQPRFPQLAKGLKGMTTCFSVIAQCTLINTMGKRICRIISNVIQIYEVLLDIAMLCRVFCTHEVCHQSGF